MSNRYVFLAVCALVGLVAGAIGGVVATRTAGGAVDLREALLANPEFIREALIELQRREEQADVEARRATIADNADEIFRSRDDFVAGNPDGKITVVEFFDYNCPYCKRALSDMDELIKNDPDVRFVLKEFPILGEGSVEAARLALAAKKQGKYLEFHRAVLSLEGKVDGQRALEVATGLGLDVERLKQDAVADEVGVVIGSVRVLAARLGVNGTPGYVIGDELIPGAIGLDGLAKKIAEVRAAASKSAGN